MNGVTGGRRWVGGEEDDGSIGLGIEILGLLFGFSFVPGTNQCLYDVRGFQ